MNSSPYISMSFMVVQIKKELELLLHKLLGQL